MGFGTGKVSPYRLYRIAQKMPEQLFRFCQHTLPDLQRRFVRMKFIMTTIQLYTYGLTTREGILFGVIPSLVLILLWVLLKRISGTRELVMLEGTIESHAGMQTTSSGKFAYFNKATFSLDDKTRVFFDTLSFTKNLWNNINANSVMEMGGKFFGWKKKDSFRVFAFSNDNGSHAFLDDFDRPHSFVRKIFNVCLRVAIILFFPYLAYGSLYWRQYFVSAQEIEQALKRPAFIYIFILLVGGYSLFSYFKQIRAQPKTFRKQLEMLDRASVKRPLG
jgi:hypothetical protein